jgi:uncharacterized 2Fe-2S/4Fe-4S cluster protein (DUF4445 family)
VNKQSVRVLFKPDSREVWVVSGSTVKEALFAAAIPVSMPCGGHGRCGKCVVKVKGKVSRMQPAEKALLPRASKHARLACMARLEGDAEVTIPETSRITIQKITARGRTSRSYRFDPGLMKVFLGSRDARRMRKLAKDFGIGIDDIALRMADAELMDRELRMDHEWRLGLHANATVVAAHDGIIGFEAGDTSSEAYGMAVDVGTNTVVCSLVDLTNGKELGTTSTINPQIVHGDDVISRIRFAKTSGGVEVLQREIVHLINGLCRELSRSLGIDPGRIYICSAVGNTAMQHILVGVSPADLGRAPYRARLLTSVEALASRSGLEAHSDCRLVMPPSLGGFVGGDLVALIISQSLHKRKVPVMAIDLGTNGEIALAADGRIFACSTAAGPAFEGERISSGVRAIKGAVEDVRIVGTKVKLTTIGGGRPAGLCGSGLIASVAELLRVKVIEPNGRIKTREEIRSKALAARDMAGERGREFVLSRRPSVRLRQGDVREVQLGKAAMCAGMKSLARSAGVPLEDVRQLLIAGSFGSALRTSSIRRIGLVPAEFGGRVRVIGNSAIEGAKIFLTSRAARREADTIASEVEHVELFSQSDFKEEFYGSMGFPDRR